MSEIVPGVAGPSKPKWEYRVYTIETTNLMKERRLVRLAARGKVEREQKSGKVETKMNELGDEGWELIPSIVQLGEDRQLLIFRRSK